MPDSQSPGVILGIVGTGAMGRGIAQIAAQAGIRTLLHDTAPGAAAAARDGIADTLARLAAKGKLTAAAAEAATARLEVVAELGQLAPADVVVEAIVEDLEAKRRLFRDLEAVVAEDCILASNTSSLSVTAIAAACTRPERVAGFHFFNPVPLMKIVEVVAGLLTAPAVAASLRALGGRMGHAAVAVRDTPGFVVNHAGRGYVTEALGILGEGVAPFHAIDRIMAEAAGFPMGPFELMDLTGLDVSHPVMESIYRQFYEEPRFRPSPIAAQRCAAGVLGRKTGRGFYAYADGRKEAIEETPAPAPYDGPVWIAATVPAWHAALAALAARNGAHVENLSRPSDAALCIVTPLGGDASSACAAAGLDAARTVAIDCLTDLARRRTLMTTPLTTPAMRDAAHGLFAADGVPVTVIRDSAGFVAQRILAMIVNIGCHIAQQRIAAPADIDRAVTLGLGYPSGPLALGDTIGPRRVLEILETLQACSGDPRYRPSPWLRRRALLGASLLTDEA